MFCDLEDNAKAIKAIADKIAGMEYATESIESDAEKLVMFQALIGELHLEMNLAKTMIKTQVKEIGGELLNPPAPNTTLNDYEGGKAAFREDLESVGATADGEAI
jgi:hypothetical protein